MTSAMGLIFVHLVFRCIELHIGLVILNTFCLLIPYHVPVDVQKGGDLHVEPYYENHPEQYALLFSDSRYILSDVIADRAIVLNIQFALDIVYYRVVRSR